MSSDLFRAKKLLDSKYTVIVIIILISISVYLNTLPNEFVYDDVDQVMKNKWIRDVRNVPKIFLTDVWAFEEIEGKMPSNYYRPFMHIIYMMDYHIFGLRPWGFHLTNIIFHAGVSVLVFLIISTLINQFNQIVSQTWSDSPSEVDKAKKGHRGKVKSQNLKSQILGPPFIASLLFATHPIHTEAVSWVGGVHELLFSFFYLISFYLYIKADGKWGKEFTLNPHHHMSAGFILSVLFFFLATFCKETTFTLPILLFAYDCSFRKDIILPLSPKTLYHLLKRYLPYLIVSGVYLSLRVYALRGFAPEKRYTQLSNYEYFINVFPLFTQYLEKLFLPINMNAFYVFHPISSILQLKGIIALILTLGFIFLVYFFRKHKVVFLCLLWIVIPLLPVLYIRALGENTFTDRYLYLPSVGFVALVSLAIEKIYRQKIFKQLTNPLIVLILIIMIGLYSVGTIRRNYVWKDNVSLFTDIAEKSPDSHMPHLKLGDLYFEQQRFEETIKEYLAAIKLKPEFLGYAAAYYNIGNVYFRLGKFDEAIKEYMIALRLKPNYAEAHNNLGRVYFEQQRFDDAI